MAKKSAKVEEIRTLMRGLPADAIDNIAIEPLEDPRYQPFAGHRLPDIVMITLIAVMTEADEWMETGIFAKAVRRHWQAGNKPHALPDFTFGDDRNTTTEKHGAQNPQTMKRVSLAILALMQPHYKTSTKNIRYTLALGFDRDIEKIFKLLNADALRSLLLPRYG